MAFSKMSLSGRVLGTVGVLLGTAVLMGTAAWVGVSRLGNEVEVATGDSAERSLLVSDVAVRSGKMRGAVRGIILYSFMKQPDLVQRSQKEFNDFAAAVMEKAARLEKLAESDTERQAAAGLAGAVRSWLPVVEQIRSLCGQGELGDVLTQTTRQSVKAADALDAATATLHQANLDRTATARIRAEGIVNTALYGQIALVLLTFFVGVVGVWQVRKATAVLRKISDGIKNGAGTVNAAADQVSSLSRGLAEGASEQAASTEETSASAEELSVLTRRNSEDGHKAEEAVHAVKQQVQTSAAALAGMVASMDAIQTSTTKVAQILKLIDEIAFQTNILALNAAVEAARAGDAGMGFGVVADEVRNLAQRCAQAAADTGRLIDESKQNTAAGAARTNDVQQAIRSITESAGMLETLIERVATSSTEQATGVDHMSKAISHIEQLTQYTAASSEEAAAASQELKDHAQGLDGLGTELQVLVDGARSAGR